VNDEGPIMLYGYPVVVEWPQDSPLSREEQQAAEREMARQVSEGVAAATRNLEEQTLAASSPKARRRRLQNRLVATGANQNMRASP
jgi:hypothetical protein